MTQPVKNGAVSAAIRSAFFMLFYPVEIVFSYSLNSKLLAKLIKVN
jgi:hypothetical protein